MTSKDFQQLNEDFQRCVEHFLVSFHGCISPTYINPSNLSFWNWRIEGSRAIYTGSSFLALVLVYMYVHVCQLIMVIGLSGVQFGL